MDTLEHSGVQTPEPANRRRRRHRARRRGHPIRRVALIAILVLLVPAGWSYAGALLAPGSAPLSARTVEWIKSHHGGPLVIAFERFWYTWHQPPVGGTPSGGIPVAAGGDAPSPSPSRHADKPAGPAHLPAPAAIRPIATNPLPQEGTWQAVGRTDGGVPAIRVTYLRPDNVHTSLLAGVMWMDTKLLNAHLIAGTQVPGWGTWPYGDKIPSSMYSNLAATFNSGFLLQDSGGGLYLDGKTVAPLKDGEASVVIYKDGSVDVGMWGRDVSMTPNVKAVRQNLWLLIDHGRLSQRLTADPNAAWGATVGGGVLVWRSGLGVTADGALVYVDGPGLSATSLATLLRRAGCVRAMELDINMDWTNGFYYSNAQTSTGFSAHPLLSDQFRPPSRYTVPDERDFFAMTLRSSGG
jgi:phosphodiester glycosidase